MISCIRLGNSMFWGRLGPSSPQEPSGRIDMELAVMIVDDLSEGHVEDCLDHQELRAAAAMGQEKEIQFAISSWSSCTLAVMLHVERSLTCLALIDHSLPIELSRALCPVSSHTNMMLGWSLRTHHRVSVCLPPNLNQSHLILAARGQSNKMIRDVMIPPSQRTE